MQKGIEGANVSVDRTGMGSALLREARNILFFAGAGAVVFPLLLLITAAKRHFYRDVLHHQQFAAVWLRSMPIMVAGGAVAGGAIYLIVQLVRRRRIERNDAARCPYCGNPIRTPLAKQCLHCHRDWHDHLTGDPVPFTRR